MPRVTLNRLSAAEVKAATYNGRSYKLYDGGGLFLQVTASGRYWRYRYKFAGKERLMALGVFPDTGLAKAREKRQDARDLLDDNIDPMARRRAEKAARVAGAEATFEALAREWWEHKHKREVVASHADRNLRRLEKYAFGKLGGRPVAEITPPEVLAALRRVERTGHLETCHRVKTLISQVFRYAVSTGRAERDVTADLADALQSAKPAHHAAVTDPAGVGALLQAIDTYPGQPATVGALRLAPLVAVRPGELRRARWDGIDFAAAQWTTTAKGGVELVVPLSRQALAILEEMRALAGGSPWVFPSIRSRARPMSDATVNAALQRLDYGSRMTGHGWRAAFRTLAVERLGWSDAVVEMQMGHRVRDVHGVAYNRTQWLGERAKLMQSWADYLDELRAGTAAGGLRGQA